MDPNDNMENIIKSIETLHTDICGKKPDDSPMTQTEKSETLTHNDLIRAVKMMADIHETLLRKQKEIDR